MTSTPTRTVDNVVITTKGLQDRNIHIIDRTTVENKGKLIQNRVLFVKIHGPIGKSSPFHQVMDYGYPVHVFSFYF